MLWNMRCAVVGRSAASVTSAAVVAGVFFVGSAGWSGFTPGCVGLGSRGPSPSSVAGMGCADFDLAGSDPSEVGQCQFFAFHPCLGVGC